jgi:PAS domain-containing protein
MKNEASQFFALQSAEIRARLYDQAFGHARIGAWECELATERLTWTSGVYELFGHPMDSPLKRANIVDLYSPDSRRDMEIARADVIRSGRSVSLDTEIRTWDGAKEFAAASRNRCSYRIGQSFLVSAALS